MGSKHEFADISQRDGKVSHEDGDGIVGRHLPLGTVVGGQIRIDGRVEAARKHRHAKVSERGVPQLLLEDAGEFEPLRAPQAGQIGISITEYHRAEVRGAPGMQAHAAFQAYATAGIDHGRGGGQHHISAGRCRKILCIHIAGLPPDSGDGKDGRKLRNLRGGGKLDGLQSIDIIGERIFELRDKAVQNAALPGSQRNIHPHVTAHQGSVPQGGGMGEAFIARQKNLRVCVLAGPAVAQVQLGLDGREKPGISSLDVESGPPSAILVRIGMEGQSCLCGEGPQGVLEKTGEAGGEVLVSQVKGTVHDGVRIHIGRQPGMELQRVRQFIIAPGGR